MQFGKTIWHLLIGMELWECSKCGRKSTRTLVRFEMPPEDHAREKRLKEWATAMQKKADKKRASEAGAKTGPSVLPTAGKGRKAKVAARQVEQQVETESESNLTKEEEAVMNELMTEFK